MKNTILTEGGANNNTQNNTNKKAQKEKSAF